MILYLLLFGISDPEPWQWPIDTQYGVTATFGEFRGDHYHMGLDFSTNGVEGQTVQAAQSGSVYRLRAQAHGYGRAVYIAHKDGYISVYAHLAAFGPRLQQAIREKGYDPDSFFGTLALNLPVQTDETLAFSGESGAGLPHFHFEVRRGENLAVNPSTLPFPRLTYSSQPRIFSVRLVPLTPTSRVNGCAWPIWIDREQEVSFVGAIGVEVNAATLGPRGSRLGPAQVQVQGPQLAHWKPKGISFDVYQSAGHVFNQAFSGFGPTQYVYRFDSVCGDSPLPDQRLLASIQSPGEWIISAEDAFGRSDSWRLAFRAEVEPSLSQNLPRLSAVQPGSLGLLPWLDHIFGLAQADGTLRSPAQALGLQAQTPFGLPVQEGELRWTQAGDTAVWQVFALRSAGIRTLGPFLLRQTQDFPATVAALLQPPDPKIQSDILVFVSPVLRFGWDGFLVSGMQISARSSEKYVGLYVWAENRQKWVYWGDPASPSGVDVDYLAPLVLAADLSDPVVGKPYIHHYFAGKRRMIPVKDQGSGIDAKALSVTSKGQPVPFSYDADRDAIVLALEQAFPLLVQVKDRAGRTVEVMLKGP